MFFHFNEIIWVQSEKRPNQKAITKIDDELRIIRKKFQIFIFYNV